MKRELNLLVRFAAAISTLLVALVAIRRILIDLQDILGIKIKIERTAKTDKQPHAPEQLLQELAAPLEAGGILLGVINDSSKRQTSNAKQATLRAAAREINPHILILGAPHTDKSGLLASLIKQDIEAGDRAVIVLDAEGELADSLSAWMKSHPHSANFADRTITFEPASDDCILGFNPMLGRPGKSLIIQADALVLAVQSISDPSGAQARFNAQTANILRNSVLLLMACDKPIADLQKLLCDTDYRDVLLESIGNRKDASPDYPLLVDTWNQYKKLMRTDQWIVWIEPILVRVGSISFDPALNRTFNKLSGNLNLTKVVGMRQIVLVKVGSQPESKFTSSLIVSQLQEAVTAVPRATSLYACTLDAALATSTIEILLKSSQRHIGIAGTLSSLCDISEDCRDLLLANVGHVLNFALSPKDAALVAPIAFKDCEEHDREPSRLTNLSNNEFYCWSRQTSGAVKIVATDPIGSHTSNHAKV
jgi:hypothetical protein